MNKEQIENLQVGDIVKDKENVYVIIDDHGGKIAFKSVELINPDEWEKALPELRDGIN